MFKRRLGYSFVCCGTIGKTPLHKTRFKKNIFGGYEGNQFFIASLLCCKMLRLTWRAHYRATTRISLSPPPPLKSSVYCTVPGISQPTLQHHYSWSHGKFEVSKSPKHSTHLYLTSTGLGTVSATAWQPVLGLCTGLCMTAGIISSLMSHSIIIVVSLALQIKILTHH